MGRKMVDKESSQVWKWFVRKSPQAHQRAIKELSKSRESIIKKSRFLDYLKSPFICAYIRHLVRAGFQVYIH